MGMIDREKVINCLTDIENIMIARQEICSREELQYWIELQEGVADALALLKEQETVLAHWDDDTGHWIEGDRDGIDPHTRTTGEMIDTFRCSWCGFYQYWKTPFCPNCGAKMEGW